jgi:hemerythrin
MKQEHLNEHRRILTECYDLAKIVHGSNAKDIKIEMAGMIKIVLINHIENFDCKFFKEAS